MLATERLMAEVPAWADRFAALITGTDPTTPVPTTPEWTLAALAAHFGGSFRWMTTIVATRATEPIRFRDTRGRRTPDDAAELPDWVREGATELVDAVRATGPETMVWSWAGGSAPAAFWLRRNLFEAVVHTADAALALGRPVAIEADLGAAGIDEWLEILPYLRSGAGALGDGHSMHLHATDDGLGPAGEWLLRGTPDGLEWEHGHAKGDVAVRGPAGVLYLLLNRRLPADDPRVEILGDRAVLDRWLAGAAF